MEIRTHINKPHPEKEGFLTLDRVLTNAELEEQIIAVLKETKVDVEGEETTAYGACEHVSYNKFDHPLKEEFAHPYSDFLVAATRGQNEGELVKILVRNSKTNAYEYVCSIKYFTGLAMARSVANVLSDALHEGMFN